MGTWLPSWRMGAEGLEGRRQRKGSINSLPTRAAGSGISLGRKSRGVGEVGGGEVGGGEVGGGEVEGGSGTSGSLSTGRGLGGAGGNTLGDQSAAAEMEGRLRDAFPRRWGTEVGVGVALWRGWAGQCRLRAGGSPQPPAHGIDLLDYSISPVLIK